MDDERHGKRERWTGRRLREMGETWCVRGRGVVERKEGRDGYRRRERDGQGGERE